MEVGKVVTDEEGNLVRTRVKVLAHDPVQAHRTSIQQIGSDCWKLFLDHTNKDPEEALKWIDEHGVVLDDKIIEFFEFITWAVLTKKTHGFSRVSHDYFWYSWRWATTELCKQISNQGDGTALDAYSHISQLQQLTHQCMHSTQLTNP